MNRILLISSNTLTEPYPAYPLGMAIVATVLSSRGHRVAQYDFLAEDRSLEKLRTFMTDFDPDFVGISIRNIDNVDSFTAESQWTLDTNREIVRIIKEFKQVPVVLGGPAFSIMPNEILDYVGADYGIMGDGGVIFADLIKQIQNGQSPPSLLGGANPLHTGDIPFQPLWDRELIEYYRKNMGVIGLQTKRGCPYSCTYCTYAAVEGGVYRTREPGAIVDDIVRLKTDFQVDTIFFTDSVFNDADDLYLGIIDELLRKDVSVTWSAFFRPDKDTVKNLGLLKRSGLSAMEVGTDAASDETLAGINKPFLFDDVLSFTEACLKEDIPCIHYIMFGGPGETGQTIKKGLENLALLEHSIILAFSGIRILPRTALYDQAISEGIICDNDSLLRPTFYFSPHINIENMNRTIEDAFRYQRQRVFPPSAGQAKLKVLHGFGFEGFQWHTLLSMNKKRARKRK